MSQRTKRYNCIAWAAGRNDAWWEAPPDGTWPSGIPHDGTVEALVRLFESLGYERTSDPSYQEGVVKVAIFGDEEGYTHAARQLPGGKWQGRCQIDFMDPEGTRKPI
jgi:hypothetical protein